MGIAGSESRLRGGADGVLTSGPPPCPSGYRPPNLARARRASFCRPREAAGCRLRSCRRRRPLPARRARRLVYIDPFSLARPCSVRIAARHSFNRWRIPYAPPSGGQRVGESMRRRSATDGPETARRLRLRVARFRERGLRNLAATRSCWRLGLSFARFSCAFETYHLHERRRDEGAHGRDPVGPAVGRRCAVSIDKPAVESEETDKCLVDRREIGGQVVDRKSPPSDEADAERRAA